MKVKSLLATTAVVIIASARIAVANAGYVEYCQFPQHLQHYANNCEGAGNAHTSPASHRGGGDGDGGDNGGGDDNGGGGDDGLRTSSAPLEPARKFGPH